MRLASAAGRLGRRAWAYLAASSGVLPVPAPALLSVGLTNACNLKCAFCHHGASVVPKEQSRPRGMMTRDVFEAILRDAKGWVDYLEFDQFGEPTLHPELAAFTARAVEEGFVTTIYTNGVTLDEAMAKALIAAGPHSIVFSMEGGTAEEFERVRGTPHAPVEANLRRLLALRRESGRRRPLVVVEGVGLEGMDGQRGAHRARYEALGVDQVGWTPAHNWSGPITPAGTPAGTLKGRAALCKYPWLVLSVDWDGTALPCCVDFNAQNALGKVPASTLKDIWKGAELRRLREALRSRDLGRIAAETKCAGCSSLAAPRLAATSGETVRLAVKAAREALR